MSLPYLILIWKTLRTPVFHNIDNGKLKSFYKLNFTTTYAILNFNFPGLARSGNLAIFCIRFTTRYTGKELTDFVGPLKLGGNSPTARLLSTVSNLLWKPSSSESFVTHLSYLSSSLLSSEVEKHFLLNLIKLFM